ncbi:hypothetical protein SUGI_0009720 [Cryptomeria japonica]|nr:hypothetical protein SUGI_0009720 [Cryptomeria japonica]
MNEIDACWRNDPNWAAHRKSLADCGIGFGSRATGGKYGEIYIVSDEGDDAVNPKYGTLRYAVIQTRPLWIIFKRDMLIKLKSELIVNSFKTIDGRGVNAEIGHGACITVQFVSHVIIHGLNIHDCVPAKPAMVRSSPSHVGHRLATDGDAIDIFGSNNIWIDHCTFSNCKDGLIDAVHSSTAITVSNCHFYHHDKVMLLGHNDGYNADKIMRATIVFNRFGPNLVQRMPRGRFGYFHVANNDYHAWESYAIGGSANPTFRSEGNRFIASDNPYTKQVTNREAGGGSGWKWRSVNDMFVNGAYFVPSGKGTCAPYYSSNERFKVYEAALVPFLTADAGRLKCRVGYPCN